MTVWTIKKNAVWGIYADGRHVTAADNEEEAKMLLESIDAIEKSDKILRVWLNGIAIAEQVDDAKSHLCAGNFGYYRHHYQWELNQSSRLPPDFDEEAFLLLFPILTYDQLAAGIPRQKTDDWTADLYLKNKKEVLSLFWQGRQYRLNLRFKQEEIHDIFFQQQECPDIINLPVPVYNDIPEPSHSMNFLKHLRCDDPLIDTMHKDVFILSGNAKSEIGIQDGANIKYVFNCKFYPFVDPVFDKTKIPEFFRTF